MRYLLVAIGVIGALVAPPWVPVIAIVALSVRWQAWEAPMIGLLVDFMWLPAGLSLAAIPYYTLLSLAIVWFLEPVRARFFI
ncbi:hypothetical protein FJY94_05070 [Candidatus Kaiserbacteria bacterium]|nr:hypothetical protein [Candidatus Kaiserbacteria bacterium]